MPKKRRLEVADKPENPFGRTPFFAFSPPRSFPLDVFLIFFARENSSLRAFIIALRPFSLHLPGRRAQKKFEFFKILST
jgi:hypothetical protein